MIKRINRLIAILFFVLTCAPVAAQYPDPVLKVLLFDTPSGVILKNQKGLFIENEIPEQETYTKLVVKRITGNKVMVNNQFIISGSLWVSGTPEISVQRTGSSAVRRYPGKIQIKPFAKGLYVINHAPTERYLEGVLNAEISTNWHIEVVKAQAVISRTFALYKMEKNKKNAWHLSAGKFDQVYLGLDIADARGRYAIGETRGIVVSYKGELAQTFYHSNCGGKTEDPGNIWQYSLPYLQVKSVPYGQKDPRFHWELTLSERELLKILRRNGLHLDSVKKLFVSKHTSSGRAYEMVFVGEEPVTMLAYDFRKKTGYRKIQSLFFDVIKTPGGYHFRGRGNGHGVGLSQWAAKEMAEVGYKYNDILYFFYTGTRLKIYHS